MNVSDTCFYPRFSVHLWLIVVSGKRDRPFLTAYSVSHDLKTLDLGLHANQQLAIGNRQSFPPLFLDILQLHCTLNSNDSSRRLRPFL